MNETTTYADLLVGTYGWVHPEWMENFYPDDLPEDWQLDYYANEFACVIVPVDTWITASTDDFQQWQDVVDEEFRFYLELPDKVESLPEGVEQLGELLGGYILRQTAPGDWRQVIGEQPLLVMDTSSSALQEYVQAGSEDKQLAWLQTSANEIIELPELREYLETALAGIMPDRQMPLIIGMQSPAVANLHNARVIADLIGA